MADILPSIPADFGDWSVAGIFHESARLMKNHFGDMVLVVLLFTFPASLIKVWYSQFVYGRQGSEPESIWNIVFYSTLDAVPQFLFMLGFLVMAHVLIERIYPNGERSQSFFTTLKSALSRKKVPPADSESGLLNKDRPTVPFHGKGLKACGAILLCLVLYIGISTSGLNFTPEAVAEMGLQPWTVFVFTVLVAAILAFSTSYLHLTGMLVFVWTMVPQTPLLM